MSLTVLVTLNSDGTFKYVVEEDGFTGVDVFTYAASDTAASDTATVKITVTTRPIAVADTFELNEDYCIKAGNFGGPLIQFWCCISICYRWRIN